MSTTRPEVKRLGHGVSVVPLPLPFRSPAWVNAYVIEGSDGVTLVDCGVDSMEGRSALVAGLSQLGLSLEGIDRLIVSHLHPDHVGLAPRLMREHGMTLIMHRRAAELYKRYNDTNGLVERTRDLALRHGVPSDSLAAFVDLGHRPQFMPQLDPPDVVVDDGDTVSLGANRCLDVIHTPGHEQAHICLRDSLTGILFSGDHVLPRITPVIMYDEQVADVLGDYLRSLRTLIDLDVGLTYPAHGVVVERGSLRCEQIILHHQRRLGGMTESVHRGPSTAWRVMGDSYRPNLTPQDQRLALRETVSHLEHLRLTGRIDLFVEADVAFYRT